MTKLYTIEELLHENVITNTPVDFIKDENVPKFYKEVFGRMADGNAIASLDDLSKDDLKQYDKDVTSIIYQPDLLKMIWNYRLESINNNIDTDTIQRYVSEIYQYIEVYLRQIRLFKEFEDGSSNVKPDYAVTKDWTIKASNTIAKIKMDLNNLFISNKLPNTLLLSKNDNGIGILATGFHENCCDEIESVDALNRIGIRVNANDLITNYTR